MSSKTVHVLISRQCANNCVFCTVAGKRAAKAFPAPEEIRTFIREVAANSAANLMFSGLGEPTLDPRFEEYLELAGSLGFKRICLFTNGFALTPEKARRWKDLGLNSVLVSMHGLEHGHDANVQRFGSFKEAVAALDVYTGLGLAVNVNTCLTRLNLEEIPELCAFLRRYPLGMHTLAFPEWSGNVEAFADDMIDYDDVVQRAGQLIPEDDGVTFFDNVPFCLVRKPVREAMELTSVTLLDGSGMHELHSKPGKVLPAACNQLACPFQATCPGFEKKYIRERGWGRLKQHALEFLEAMADAETRERLLAVAVPGPRRDRTDRPGIMAIVKPTARCNAGCRYCASQQAQPRPMISSELCSRFCDELVAHAEHQDAGPVTFLWHGGEPLLLGTRFYKEIWTDLCKHKNGNVRHLLQTNLLLLDSRWVELLRRFDVHVSTSVDPFTDERVYPDGRDQYPDWLERFSLACEAGLKMGLVFTVTVKHEGREAETYRFLRNLQTFSEKPVSVRLNPVYGGGNCGPLSPAVELPAEVYGEFLCGMWDLWQGDGQPFPLDPFRAWATGGGLACEFSGRCSTHFVGLDSMGNVFSCGRFADSGVPRGNIQEEPLAEILTRPQLPDVSGRSERLLAGHCRDCPYWDLCHGGCPYHALVGSGDALAATPYCEGYRLFFERSGLGARAHEKE